MRTTVVSISFALAGLLFSAPQDAVAQTNVQLGPGALQANTSGVYNAALGPYAMVFNTTGSSNTATGFGALYANTSAFYNTANGSFLINNQALSAGNHTLTIYGLEGCCDGGQQVQYAAAGNAFQSFNANTLAPVPEPETYAMLLGGLALVGGYARRRNNKA